MQVIGKRADGEGAKMRGIWHDHQNLRKTAGWGKKGREGELKAGMWRGEERKGEAWRDVVVLREDEYVRNEPLEPSRETANLLS